METSGSTDGAEVHMADDPLVSGVSHRWRAWRAVVDLDEYDTRWDRRAAQGFDVHGEADAVERAAQEFAAGTRTVLDGGCGTGRVAIELARRGWQATGADADADLLAYARRRAPELNWLHVDLCRMDLGRRFGVVVLAGGVASFVDEASRPLLVPNLIAHLEPGGLLISGGPIGDEAEVLAWASALESCGAQDLARWSTWEGEPYQGGDYLITVDRAPA